MLNILERVDSGTDGDNGYYDDEEGCQAVYEEGKLQRRHYVIKADMDRLIADKNV